VKKPGEDVGGKNAAALRDLMLKSKKSNEREESKPWSENGVLGRELPPAGAKLHAPPPILRDYSAYKKRFKVPGGDARGNANHPGWKKFFLFRQRVSALDGYPGGGGAF